MDPRIIDRLSDLGEELTWLERRLADPEVLADGSQLAALGKRHAEVRELVDLFDRWQRADTDRREAVELAAADPELADELAALATDRQVEATETERQIRLLLAPHHPDADKDAIVEIRAAAGGEEATLWAGDLVRMYQRWAERRGLRPEIMEAAGTDSGGYSKAILAIAGRRAYDLFRFEAGVHRVQRVPKTESQGRVHTSTATVAVLPEAEAVEMEIDPADVRVDVFRSSGPGGQSVNTTDSAVRLTHEPTGLVVSCQDEKSQLQNKDKAFRILRARLYQLESDRRREEQSGTRRSQVGTGERSEKIRTYNFKENRVTDHRVERTAYNLDRVLDGELDGFVEALREAETDEALED